MIGRDCCSLSRSLFAAGKGPIGVAVCSHGTPAVYNQAGAAVHGYTQPSRAVEVTVITSGQTVKLGTRSCVGGKIEHVDAISKEERV